MQTHEQSQLVLLVGFLPVCTTWAGPTVIGLDNKGVLFLALTVHRAAGSQHSFS